MEPDPAAQKDVDVEAPEVVVALLGHGGMISKFCHLEASPQNNEARWTVWFALFRDGDVI